MVVITLNQIKACNPCAEGWQMILQARKAKSSTGEIDYDEQWPLIEALDSNPLEHVMWSLRCVADRRIAVLFSYRCALRVKEKMPAASMEALTVVGKWLEGRATQEEVTSAAWSAARSAASAAWSAASAAWSARSAASAAWSARSAAWSARSAASAAWSAESAWSAQSAAQSAQSAAGSAERAAQTEILRDILTNY